MRGVRWLLVACLIATASGCGLSIKKLEPGSPLSGTKVLVQEFDMGGVKESNVDGSFSTSGFGLEVAQSVAKWLREAGVQAEAVPRGTAPAGVYVVKGEVLHVDGGSRALRYWVGFGAGATEIAVTGQTLGTRGETVGTFSDARRSGFGIFGGDSETLLHRCVDSVGNDVASMVTTGQYAQHYLP